LKDQELKVLVSDPKGGKVTTVELEGVKARPLVGRELGDEVDGSLFGMAGTKLKITGGSDKDGIPLVANIHGGAKKYVLLAGGVGFKGGGKGERRRKLVRGRMITDETYQLNMVISETESTETTKEIVTKETERGGDDSGNKGAQ
jgi:small subunit ribosomal protein S6e